MTASGATSQNSAIFSFTSCGRSALRAAEQNVGLNTDGAQLFDAVLGGLCLQFLCGGDPRNQCEVHEECIVAALFMAHLPDGFDERQRFNVAHSSADFNNGNVDISSNLAARCLDFVRDVRNHLHGFAQVMTAPLAGDDVFVDTAGREIVALSQVRMSEPLVVAKVQVCFGPIVRDKDFSVLERAVVPGSTFR